MWSGTDITYSSLAFLDYGNNGGNGFRIMKAFNYSPQLKLRDLEPTAFNYLSKPSTEAGGNLGHA